MKMEELKKRGIIIAVSAALAVGTAVPHAVMAEELPATSLFPQTVHAEMESAPAEAEETPAVTEEAPSVEEEEPAMNEEAREIADAYITRAPELRENPGSETEEAEPVEEQIEETQTMSEEAREIAEDVPEESVEETSEGLAEESFAMSEEARQIADSYITHAPKLPEKPEKETEEMQLTDGTSAETQTEDALSEAEAETKNKEAEAETKNTEAESESEEALEDTAEDNEEEREIARQLETVPKQEQESSGMSGVTILVGPGSEPGNGTPAESSLPVTGSGENVLVGNKKKKKRILVTATPLCYNLRLYMSITYGGMIMKHIKTLNTKNLQNTVKKGGCGECQTSCQSACKTSCTVGNQSCESKR